MFYRLIYMFFGETVNDSIWFLYYTQIKKILVLVVAVRKLKQRWRQVHFDDNLS